MFDEVGTQTHRYLHGPNIDQILAEETAAGAVHWALTDHQGSVRDVIDNGGNILNRIVYDSFGQVTSETNPDFDFRFGYTGRELDKVTGLMYYRARYYDPAVGRFLSEDPIGFDAGDANLYRDVFNSPTNYTDPSGNAAFPVIPIIVAGIVTPFVADTLWSPVQSPETCNDINPGLPWYLRIPAETALGAGIGAAPGIARGVGGSIARQLPSILDDIARGAGSIGDDIGRVLAGSGDELIPALPGGGRLPTGAVDDFNPAAPLRSQGNPGGGSSGVNPGTNNSGADDADAIIDSFRQGRQSLSEGRQVPANNANAADALNRNYRTLERAQANAERVRELPDGRVRYYGAETPARTPGRTRGSSLVTEYNRTIGRVRTWYESYDHAGNVNRVHPKPYSGFPVNSGHIPPTGKELGQ